MMTTKIYNNNFKRVGIWERLATAKLLGFVWRDIVEVNKHGTRLCSISFRNAYNLHFYRIPKDRDIRKKYVVPIRNETLKVVSRVHGFVQVILMEEKCFEPLEVNNRGEYG